jgi:hypothetical protein
MSVQREHAALIKLIRTVACIVLLVAPVAMDSAAAAGADPQPAEILTGIYKEAVKGTTSDWLEPKRRGNYLSKSLLALWAKADRKTPKGEVGAIDFDLTTDTNALELKGFEIKSERQSDMAAVFAVKLAYREPYVRKGPPPVVTYEFIREGGRWRIDNIRAPEWSVRDLLTLWLKGA